eukprot:gene4727-6632_t
MENIFENNELLAKVKSHKLNYNNSQSNHNNDIDLLNKENKSTLQSIPVINQTEGSKSCKKVQERSAKIIVLPDTFNQNQQTVLKSNKSGIVSSKDPKATYDMSMEYYREMLRKCDINFGQVTLKRNELNLPNQLRARLFKHQLEGVEWMYRLFLSDIPGGILGDDMGLGKTFQVTCLMCALVRSNLINRILIVAPVSVLQSWYREIVEYLRPHITSGKIVIEIASSDVAKKKRQKILSEVFECYSKSDYSVTHIIITSYHIVANMSDDFSLGEWDYVILDEGHLIKNPSTKVSKAVHCIDAKHKLLLSGTPIQNNLNEFYAIANWVTSNNRNSNLLGTLAQFKSAFSTPIIVGQDPNALSIYREQAECSTKLLMNITKHIVLQRKKCDFEAVLALPDKVDIVIWIPLATKQRDMYESYLKSRYDYLQNLNAYPLEAINQLKTICRHPFLLEVADRNRDKRNGVRSSSLKSNSSDDVMDSLNRQLDDLTINEGTQDEDDYLIPSSANANKQSAFDLAGREPTLHELLQGSIKLRVLSKLVTRLHRNGHRTLIFSQSKLMLDVIQFVLLDQGLGLYRIDGSTTGRERQRIIDEFNEGGDPESSFTGPSVCLLTTKACGTGVTLTGADRVIIFDPSWNPAEDRQAVDRAYRIGQKRTVVVFRMIMSSAIEEKIYEKQVFKDGLRVVTESGSSNRYFSNNETKELFRLGPKGRSLVMEKLWLRGSGLHALSDHSSALSHQNNSKINYADCEFTHGELTGALGYTRHDMLQNEKKVNDSNNNNSNDSISASSTHDIYTVQNNDESSVSDLSNDGLLDDNKTSKLTQQTLDSYWKNKVAVVDLTMIDNDDENQESKNGKSTLSSNIQNKRLHKLGQSNNNVINLVDSDNEIEWDEHDKLWLDNNNLNKKKNVDNNNSLPLKEDESMNELNMIYSQLQIDSNDSEEFLVKNHNNNGHNDNNNSNNLCIDHNNIDNSNHNNDKCDRSNNSDETNQIDSNDNDNIYQNNNSILSNRYSNGSVGSISNISHNLDTSYMIFKNDHLKNLQEFHNIHSKNNKNNLSNGLTINTQVLTSIKDFTDPELFPSPHFSKIAAEHAIDNNNNSNGKIYYSNNIDSKNNNINNNNINNNNNIYDNNKSDKKMLFNIPYSSSQSLSSSIITPIKSGYMNSSIIITASSAKKRYNRMSFASLVLEESDDEKDNISSNKMSHNNNNLEIVAETYSQTQDSQSESLTPIIKVSTSENVNESLSDMSPIISLPSKAYQTITNNGSSCNNNINTSELGNDVNDSVDYTDTSLTSSISSSDSIEKQGCIAASSVARIPSNPPKLFYDSIKSNILQTLGWNDFQFTPQHPLAYMTDENIVTYNDCVSEGLEHESMNDYNYAIRKYAEAMDLCDEDIVLFGKIAWMSQLIK